MSSLKHKDTQKTTLRLEFQITVLWVTFRMRPILELKVLKIKKDEFLKKIKAEQQTTTNYKSVAKPALL